MFFSNAACTLMDSYLLLVLYTRVDQEILDEGRTLDQEKWNCVTAKS